MKHVVVVMSLLSAANLRVCESEGPAGSASASVEGHASADGAANAAAIEAAKTTAISAAAAAKASLVTPRIGGSIVAAGDHSVEVALHQSGLVEALVLDASGKAVTDAKLGITATAKGGAKQKIALAFAAPRARFEGRAKAGVELASGPVDVALEVAGKPIEAKLDLGVVLPQPKLGGHVLVVGDLGAEVVARANGDIDARLFDSAGAEIKGGVDVKARFGAGGDIDLAFDPGRACFHGQAKAGLTPGSLQLSVGAGGKAKVGALASASLVASAAHGGQVVAVGDYSVELVAKGPEIAAFVFDASGKALAAADVDLALDLGANLGTHVALEWDAPSLSYKANVGGKLDLSVEPIRVSLNAAGKAFVGAVASLKGAAAATLDAAAKVDTNVDARLGAKAGLNAKLEAPKLDAKVAAGADAGAKAAAAASAKLTPPKVNVSVNKSATAGASTGAKTGAGAKASAGFSFGTK
jgi:hypothetical protein